MQIREIAESEIGFLEEMLYEALFVEEGQPKLPKSLIKEPELSRYIENFGLQKMDLCLVAVKEEKLIGACWGRLFSEANKGFGFLDSETPELSIAVKSNYRNQGVGSKLIEEIIQLYRTTQVKSLSLSVDKKNPAFGLYRKIGFEVIEETQKSVVMRMMI